MHSPSAEPHPSIYYRYHVFEAYVALQRVEQPRHNIVIAGAGPAGLVTALELARYGVASVVLEAERQVSLGSRAIVFTRRSLEIMQQVGVSDRVTQNGLPWRFGNSFYRGQCVFRMEAPHDENDRFSPLTNLQQQYLEEYLIDACIANPLIEIRWGNKIVSTTQSKGFATLEVDTPAGLYSMDAVWLVAADGARSGLRSALGLKMEGASYEGRFVIADIRIDLPLPTERRAYFDPDWNRGNTILMHREPHGIWRIDYQLPAGETPDQALSPESLKTRIDAQLAMIGHGGVPWQMDWCSVYSARTLTLPDYVHGSVIFVGDAAHLLPIFGVRGANTAFQDAQSLGWHLAFVVKGLASPALLANYSEERVAAAREIIGEAGKSTRFMTPPSRGFRLLRDAVLSLSLEHAFVRPLFHWRTARPHAYEASRLNAPDDDDSQFTAGPGHGAPPQNVRLGDDEFLLDHLGGGFDLLFFVEEENDEIPESVIRVVERNRSNGLPIKIIACGTARRVAVAALALPDPQGQIRSRYGISPAGGAYLLRPDQHVCARWMRLDARRLDSAIARALGGSAALHNAPAHQQQLESSL
jgi:3-(3-hydroxy-phenyl)propionate hydroxylase